MNADEQDWKTNDYIADGRKRRRLQRCPSRSCESDPVPQDMRQRLKRIISPSRWMLIDGLYNGLDALLKGTAKHTQQDSCGARSLFSTCLRKVPEYIAVEEAWHESQDEDEAADVCSEVYNVLEDMASTDKEGWKPLREVVRAHGLAMLSDAVREGLIDQFVGRGLVILCIHAKAFQEAATLLVSLISSLNAIPQPAKVDGKLLDSNVTACLDTLDLFVSQSGRYGFQYRQFEVLLRDGLLPIEWLATAEFAPIWGRVVKSISHGDKDFGDASQLLITATMLACGSSRPLASDSIQILRRNMSRGELLPSLEPSVPVTDRFSNTGKEVAGLTDALNNTVSSLMTIVQAISTLQCDRIQQERSSGLPDSDMSASALVGPLTLDALRAVELSNLTRRNNAWDSTYRRRTSTVLMALFFLSKERQSSQNNFRALSSTCNLDIAAALTSLCEPNSLEASSEVATFVASIARCCARASPGQEFDHLQRLVYHLVSVANEKTASTEARHLFACHASTAAMAYAEQTGDSSHVDWALEIEEDVMKQGRVSARTIAKTPRKEGKAQSQGYRWEEGICEWIAKTPIIHVENYSLSPEPLQSTSKSDEEPTKRSHHKAPIINIPFCLGIDSPLRSEETLSASSTQVSMGTFTSQENQTPTFISTSEHPKTTIHAGHEQPRSRKQKWSSDGGIRDAGPNSTWKLHVDNNEDELSTLNVSAEHVKARNWKLGITGLGSTCKWPRASSRQALRSSNHHQPLRFGHGLRQSKVQQALGDGSEDELGI